MIYSAADGLDPANVASANMASGIAGLIHREANRLLEVREAVENALNGKQHEQETQESTDD